MKAYQEWKLDEKQVKKPFKTDVTLDDAKKVMNKHKKLLERLKDA